jgi:hypothetical protein
MMQDPPDYDLRPTDPATDPAAAVATRPRGRWAWIIGLTAAAAVAVVGFLLWRAPQAPQGAETPAATADAAASPHTAPIEPSGPLGAPATPVYLPPLDQTDHVVRPLLSALSAHPRVLRLLATDNLIRRFAASVDNISRGDTPAVHLQTLRPDGAYQFADEEDVVLANPAGYARYNGIADAMASVDVAEAARLYTALKPRLDDAYRELGHAEPFDRAMERAILALLNVPAVRADVRLEPKGALFLYADPALEGLTAAQKQLLRMGPRNVRLIQGALRQLAVELGIPETRLPA